MYRGGPFREEALCRKEAHVIPPPPRLPWPNPSFVPDIYGSSLTPVTLENASTLPNRSVTPARLVQVESAVQGYRTLGSLSLRRVKG